MVEAFGNLNGDGPQQVWVHSHRTGQSGNQSHYYGEVRYYGNGYGSWINATQYWSANFGGHQYSGTFNIPQGEAYHQYKVLAGVYFSINHDGAGYMGGFGISACIDSNHSRLGDGCAYANEPAAPRIAKVPGKPPRPTFRSATPTTVEYNFSAPSDNGGSGITTYNHQSATDSGFTQNVRNWDDAGSPATADSLTPGVPHHFRYRARNAVGAGPWSDSLSQVTLPAVAPGFTVVANPTGQSAVLTFSPPGGVTGVAKYTYERRLQGSSAATSAETPTSPKTQAGLSPGKVYEWRASAWIGEYQSPWTGWIAVQQPNPNTNAGDYFDGDTPDGADIDYGWSGTPGNSTSRATGKVVVGWTNFSGGNAAGSTGVQHQVTGGAVLDDGSIAGGFAARYLFHSDANAAGWNGGTARLEPGWADVVPGGTYFGSLYAYVSRPQVLAAVMIFSDGAGAAVGANIVGPSQIVPANRWTRLIMSALAPEGAEYLSVRATDVNDGSGAWSTFKGGDSIILDAAMVSLGEPLVYFDGGTTDTPNWDFEWLGSPDAAPSQATALPGAVNDPLADPECPRPPAAPRPPVILDDCIVDAGTWLRYWSVIPETVVTEWLTMVPTIALYIGDVAARQVRVRLYPNPEGLAPEDFTGEWSSEQIVSYMPPNSVMLIDGVDQRAWATVGASPRLRADHLLYGTGGTPATWPLLNCGIGYLASFDVPVPTEADPSPQLDVEIALTQRRSA